MPADPEPLPTTTAELLPLALSRPHEALERARDLLSGNPPPLAASVARQAVGIVLREFGDIDAAVQELRTARRLARRSGSAEREADVQATLGVALAFAGRTTAGRNALDAAVRQSAGQLNGRILLRRGGVLLTLGHHHDALADLNNAITALRAADDPIWEARARTERATCNLALGSIARAATDLARAEDLFNTTGQELESADAIVHRGVLALRIGDLPAALLCFDQAAERFDKLGTPDPRLSIERCAALLAAGLPQDALDEAHTAVTQLERIHGQPTKKAELLLTAANCALAAGRPGDALDHATQAADLFDRQHRHWWRAHARLVEVRAQLAAGTTGTRLLRQAEQCARELATLSSPDLPLAHLIAGRLALALGDSALAAGHLATAARGRRRGPALSRAVAWLAEALRAEAAHDPARLMRACRRGLQVLDQHRATLGSSELRAQASAHGAELAALGQRHALRLDRPRLLLSWSERWRATALAVPAVRPPDDERLQAELAAIRAVTSNLAQARAGGLPTAHLSAEQRRLERAARSRALHAHGHDAAATPGCDVDALLDELADGRLLELVDVDGHLHVIVCGSGAIRRYPAGRTEQAARHIDLARFTLSRLAHGRSALTPAELLTQLESLGHTLEQALLGDAVHHLGDRDVTIVPPGRLHAVPWALLPSLRHRPLSVAPSARSWLRARHTGTPGHGRVVLVRGPGLASQGAEIRDVTTEYPAPIVLGEGSATVGRVLRAMDGARLVHIAAHGTFRADSPLFSALRVDDGPLTVYDLERLNRAPGQVILSSCDSGLTAPTGADELLGLASSLIQLGTTAIAASVVLVNDVAAVPLMIALHRRLRTGAGLATALRDARLDTAGDPVATATGLAFVCLGAG
ncbi:CHAT domain-containing protein [Nonomuraea sp. LPB2021202275-12-8]|uniref:CHAT domain-containing protein n=1 Tax=Nonomuraea sp. LPB2021202275-12-8 TaxID=3120159 RepID=UPI00300C534E